MNIFTDIHKTEWEDKCINILLVSLCWFGGVAIVMSLFRASSISLQLSHYVQIGVFVLILLTTLNKHRLSIKVKVINVIITSTLVSYVGIYDWGLYSASFFWILFTPLLLAIFFTYQKALWFIVATIIFILICSYMYTSGQLKLPIDADEYQTMYSAWGTVLFGDVFMMVMLVIILSNMKQHILQLVTNLEQEQQKIIKIADHDELTGLPVSRILINKLNDVLASQHRENRHIAILFMDLDGFKSVNDNYGHDAGDTVLKEIATRLKQCLREEDTLVRMGGDEFIALCSSPNHILLDTEQLASRIINTISKPLKNNENAFNLGISIGIALSDPDGLESAEKMIQRADFAMYEVKRAGKNSYRLAEKAEQESPELVLANS